MASGSCESALASSIKSPAALSVTGCPLSQILNDGFCISVKRMPDQEDTGEPRKEDACALPLFSSV
jgi:hypothetical protein